MLLQEEKEDEEEHGQNVESTFCNYECLTLEIDQFLYTGYFSHILHLDIIKSEINFKLKVKMNKILIYGFQWG